MQAWSTDRVQIPAVVETTTTTTVSGSQITQEDYDKLKSHNERLECEVIDLKDMFAQFMRKQATNDSRITTIVCQAIRAKKENTTVGNAAAATSKESTSHCKTNRATQHVIPLEEVMLEVQLSKLHGIPMLAWLMTRRLRYHDGRNKFHHS